MLKIVVVSFCLLLTYTGDIFGKENKNGESAGLSLQCSIHFSDFNGIKQASTAKNVKIENLKHQQGGSVLVSQTDDYEFWVMVHGQQTIADQEFIINFQVAIKEKKTELFMHALSDTSHNPARKPLKARISLVEYHPNSFLEKGELFFECSSLDEYGRLAQSNEYT